jgi:hypothetical protein
MNEVGAHERISSSSPIILPHLSSYQVTALALLFIKEGRRGLCGSYFGVASGHGIVSIVILRCRAFWLTMQVLALNLLLFSHLSLLTPVNRQRIASFDSEGKTSRYPRLV